MSESSSKISEARERQLRGGVWVVSVLVWIVVGLMRRPEWHLALPEGVSLDFLPAVYSGINVLVATCLVLAVMAVKRGEIEKHRHFITAAMALSGLFLLLYVAYHFTSSEVKYAGTGWVRPVYFFLLITHVVLAAVTLPFILLAYLSGWADRRAAHRRMVKVIFPLWFYVAVSGPVVYLMLHVLPSAGN